MTRFVRCVAKHDRDVGIGRLLDNVAVRGGGVLGEAVDVDPRSARERQDAVVREQHHRSTLRLAAGRPEVGAAARCRRDVGIDIRIVEEPEAELVAQNPPRRLVDARLGHTPGVDELHEQVRQRLAAELVAARFDDLQQPLGGVELLDAPRLGLPDRAVWHRASVTSPQSVHTTPSKP